MRAEIIAFGDELTSGQRPETNSRWLSQRLVEMGVEVAFQTVVGDDLENSAAALRTASVPTGHERVRLRSAEVFRRRK